MYSKSLKGVAIVKLLSVRSNKRLDLSGTSER